VGSSLSRHERGDLAIDVAEHGDALVLAWRGRSDAREPGCFLVPVLDAAFERARGGDLRLVLDFTAVEYMNSSTFTPVVKLVAQARAAGVRVALEYARARSWQALSFSALRTFETRDGRITVSGK
jgi:anti-anti-sigma factor